MAVRGQGRATFAAILLLVAGTLNAIYGIAAIGDAHFYAGSTHYVVSDLSTWGWVTLILGVLQLIAGVSLMRGNAFGRIFGIFGATLGAIGALLGISGAYPFWSLGVFAICLIVLHGLVVYGEEQTA